MSTKKRPAKSELRGTLLEGHFGQSRELPPADPIAPTHMHLPIDQIKPYDRNPRREENPRYAEIKDSIRAKRGLDDPIGITRRPGDDLYMVRAGGNTRLRILKELYQETGDEAFSKAYCLFVPWISDSDCITSHLIENELRGELLFIDKAAALKDLKAQIEQEENAPLSRSEFERRLASIGYRVSRRQLIRCEYAADVLDPLIPWALRGGLGGREIDKIREAESIYRRLAEKGGIGERFDEIFHNWLARSDTETWVFEVERPDLEGRLADELSIPLCRLTTAADLLQHGGDIGQVRLLGGPEEDAVEQPPPDSESGGPDSLDLEPEAQPKAAIEAAPAPESPVMAEKAPAPARAAASAATTGPMPRPPAFSPPPSPGPAQTAFVPEAKTHPDRFLSEELNAASDRQPPANDLKSLRGRCYVLALRFAQTLELQYCIASVRGGHGFFVSLPKAPFKDEDDIKRWGWWMLQSLSEHTIAGARLQRAPQDELRDLLLANRTEEVFNIAGFPPDVSDIANGFLTDARLSGRAFQDLLLLIETCRRIRTAFSEQDVWGG